MKVVLFCGGQGLRIRDASPLPKPLVPVGDRPILWHVMRYYAHFGHTEFVVCLGYKGETIARYVRESPDVNGWRIKCVDTGESTSIGERLRRVKEHVQDEEVFLCNYADGLTDLQLPDLVKAFYDGRKIAAMVSVRPSLSYHFVRTGADGTVTELEEINNVDLRINGGYFVLKREIFDYMNEGEDLVGEPFRRLIRIGALLGYPYDGFWKNMDTFKDKQVLDDLYALGNPPWQVWNGAHKNGQRLHRAEALRR